MVGLSTFEGDVTTGGRNTVRNSTAAHGQGVSATDTDVTATACATDGGSSTLYRGSVCSAGGVTAGDGTAGDVDVTFCIDVTAHLVAPAVTILDAAGLHVQSCAADQADGAATVRSSRAGDGTAVNSQCSAGHVSTAATSCRTGNITAVQADSLGAVNCAAVRSSSTGEGAASNSNSCAGVVDNTAVSSLTIEGTAIDGQGALSHVDDAAVILGVSIGESTTVDGDLLGSSHGTTVGDDIGVNNTAVNAGTGGGVVTTVDDQITLVVSIDGCTAGTGDTTFACSVGQNCNSTSGAKCLQGAVLTTGVGQSLTIQVQNNEAVCLVSQQECAAVGHIGCQEQVQGKTIGGASLVRSTIPFGPGHTLITVRAVTGSSIAVHGQIRRELGRFICANCEDGHGDDQCQYNQQRNQTFFHCFDFLLTKIDMLNGQQKLGFHKIGSICQQPVIARSRRRRGNP